MNFTTIATGSTGNSYILETTGRHGKHKLLLEAGIGIKKIKKALDYDFSSLDGVLISHEHQDHARAVKDLLKCAVNIYMTEGTREALGLQHHRIKTFKAYQDFLINDVWRILPIEAKHDAAEPAAYLIYNKDTRHKALFATDTMYLKDRFKGLNYLFIEANYSREILDQRRVEGETELFRKKYILNNHLSIEAVEEFLEANDTSQLKSIHLLHASDAHSDIENFRDKIQYRAGVPTYIAGE